ncbi:Zn-dependent protease with chaperone function [Cryobacterium psychrotolerans]|nr:Zn-dependent protease with chaperone function [Cryobacterium psychrotolerans]
MKGNQVVILVVVRFGLLVGAVATFILGMSLPRAVGDPLVIASFILTALYLYFWFRVRWLIKKYLKKIAADQQNGAADGTEGQSLGT